MQFVMNGAEAKEVFGKMLSAKFTNGNMRAAKVPRIFARVSRVLMCTFSWSPAEEAAPFAFHHSFCFDYVADETRRRA